MNTYLKHTRHRFWQRVTSFFIILTFIASSIIPPQNSYAQMPVNLPSPGVMLPPSPGFAPTVLRGLKVYPESPFQFDFFVEPGDSTLQDDAFKDESNKLIKYFLASLTTPEDELWVNLSPYEKDRIISDGFGLTEMGRDLLAQDYLLKQLTASFIHPDKELGQKFWDRVYKKAFDLYGTTEISVNTFNKVWIVPQTAEVYETRDVAFVVDSRLKVMLEEDYLALSKNLNDKKRGTDQMVKVDVDNISKLSSSIVRELIIPEIEKEVNEGKNFANLRQIYHSLILAAWYKRTLKQSLLSQIYVDQNKISGVNADDPKVKEKIYQQYLEAYKKGVYNFIQEDYDEYQDQVIPRKYFSGGTELKVDDVLKGRRFDKKTIWPRVKSRLADKKRRSGDAGVASLVLANVALVASDARLPEGLGEASPRKKRGGRDKGDSGVAPAVKNVDESRRQIKKILDDAGSPLTLREIWQKLLQVPGHEKSSRRVVSDAIYFGEGFRSHHNFRLVHDKNEIQNRRDMLVSLLDLSDQPVTVKELHGYARLQPGYQRIKYHTVYNDTKNYLPLMEHESLIRPPEQVESEVSQEVQKRRIRLKELLDEANEPIPARTLWERLRLETEFKSVKLNMVNQDIIKTIELRKHHNLLKMRDPEKVEARRKALLVILNNAGKKISTFELWQEIVFDENYEGIAVSTVRSDVQLDQTLKKHPNIDIREIDREAVQKRRGKLLEYLEEGPHTARDLWVRYKEDTGQDDIAFTIIQSGDVMFDVRIHHHPNLVKVQDRDVIQERRDVIFRILEQSDEPLSVGDIHIYLSQEPGYEGTFQQTVDNDVRLEPRLRLHANLSIDSRDSDATARRDAIVTILDEADEQLTVRELWEQINDRGYYVDIGKISLDAQFDPRIKTHPNLRLAVDHDQISARREMLLTILNTSEKALTVNDLWEQARKEDDYADLEIETVRADTQLTRELKLHENLIFKRDVVQNRRDLFYGVLEEAKKPLNVDEVWQLAKNQDGYDDLDYETVANDFDNDPRLNTHLNRNKKSQRPKTHVFINTYKRLEGELNKPPTYDQLAESLNITSTLVGMIVRELKQEGIELKITRKKSSSSKQLSSVAQARKDMLLKILNKIPADEEAITREELVKRAQEIEGYDDITYARVAKDVSSDSRLINHTKLRRAKGGKAVSDPGDAGTAPSLFTTEQEGLISEAQDRHREKYLDMLIRIKEDTSIFNIIYYFKSAAIPEGALRRISGPSEFILKELQEVGLNDLGFEFAFRRIKGTDQWIIIKGSKRHVPANVTLMGVDGPLDIKKVTVPNYLFDIDGHNHPRQSQPIPSADDLVRFYFDSQGEGSRFVIRGHNGLTVVDLQGAIKFSDGDQFRSRISALVKSFESALRDAGYDFKEDEFIPVDDPDIRVFYEKEISALEDEGLISRKFIPWDEVTDEIFETTQLPIGEQMRSPHFEVAKRALSTLHDLSRDFDVPFRLSLLDRIVRDSSEELQYYTLYNLFILVGTDEESNQARAVFEQSAYPIIPALASLLGKSAKSINENVPQKYKDFFESTDIDHLSSENRTKVFYMLNGELEKGLKWGAREIESEDIDEIGREILEMYLSRLTETGMSRGGESDPLVRAANALREKWGMDGGDAGTAAGGTLSFAFDQHDVLVSYIERIKTLIAENDVIVLEGGPAIADRKTHEFMLGVYRGVSEGSITPEEAKQRITSRIKDFVQGKNEEEFLKALYNSKKAVYLEREIDNALWRKKEKSKIYLNNILVSEGFPADLQGPLGLVEQQHRASAQFDIDRDNKFLRQLDDIKKNHSNENILVIRGAGHSGMYVKLKKEKTYPPDELRREFLMADVTFREPTVQIERKLRFEGLGLSFDFGVDFDELLVQAFLFRLIQEGMTPDEVYRKLNGALLTVIVERVKGRSDLQDLAEALNKQTKKNHKTLMSTTLNWLIESNRATYDELKQAIGEKTLTSYEVKIPEAGIGDTDKRPRVRVKVPAILLYFLPTTVFEVRGQSLGAVWDNAPLPTSIKYKIIGNLRFRITDESGNTFDITPRDQQGWRRRHSFKNGERLEIVAIGAEDESGDAGRALTPGGEKISNQEMEELSDGDLLVDHSAGETYIFRHLIKRAVDDEGRIIKTFALVLTERRRGHEVKMKVGEAKEKLRLIPPSSGPQGPAEAQGLKPFHERIKPKGASASSSGMTGDPQLNENNVYANALKRVLNDSFMTDESKRRLTALGEIGPELQEYMQEKLRDPALKMAIVPLGSGLKGYSGTESDVEFGIVILSGETTSVTPVLADAIAQKAAELLDQKGLKLDDLDFANFEVSNVNEIAEFEQGIRDDITEAMLNLFLPVSFAGDSRLLENIRREFIAVLDRSEQGDAFWKKIAFTFNNAFSIGAPHVKVSSVKGPLRRKVSDIARLKDKEHLVSWLKGQGVSEINKKTLGAFNTKRIKAVKFPTFKEIKKVYLPTQTESADSEPISPQDMKPGTGPSTSSGQGDARPAKRGGRDHGDSGRAAGGPSTYKLQKGNLIRLSNGEDFVLVDDLEVPFPSGKPVMLKRRGEEGLEEVLIVKSLTQVADPRDGREFITIEELEKRLASDQLKLSNALRGIVVEQPTEKAAETKRKKKVAALNKKFGRWSEERALELAPDNNTNKEFVHWDLYNRFRGADHLYLWRSVDIKDEYVEDVQIYYNAVNKDGKVNLDKIRHFTHVPSHVFRQYSTSDRFNILVKVPFDNIEHLSWLSYKRENRIDKKGSDYYEPEVTVKGEVEVIDFAYASDALGTERLKMRAREYEKTLLSMRSIDGRDIDTIEYYEATNEDLSTDAEMFGTDSDEEDADEDLLPDGDPGDAGTAPTESEIDQLVGNIQSKVKMGLVGGWTEERTARLRGLIIDLNPENVKDNLKGLARAIPTILLNYPDRYDRFVEHMGGGENVGVALKNDPEKFKPMLDKIFKDWSNFNDKIERFKNELGEETVIAGFRNRPYEFATGTTHLFSIFYSNMDELYNVLLGIKERLGEESVKESFIKNPESFANGLQIISKEWKDFESHIEELKERLGVENIRNGFINDAFYFALSLSQFFNHWELFEELISTLGSENVGVALGKDPQFFENNIKTIFSDWTKFRGIAEQLGGQNIGEALRISFLVFAPVLRTLYKNYPDFVSNFPLLKEKIGKEHVVKSFLNKTEKFIEPMEKILKKWDKLSPQIDAFKELLGPDVVGAGVAKDISVILPMEWGVKDTSRLMGHFTETDIKQAFRNDPVGVFDSNAEIFGKWAWFTNLSTMLGVENLRRAYRKSPSQFAKSLEYIHRLGDKFQELVETVGPDKIGKIWGEEPSGFIELIGSVVSHMEVFEDIALMGNQENFQQGVASLRTEITKADPVRRLEILGLASIAIKMRTYDLDLDVKSLGMSEITAATLIYLEKLLDESQEPSFQDLEDIVREQIRLKNIYKNYTTEGGKIHLNIDPKSNEAKALESFAQILGLSTQAQAWDDARKSLELHLKPAVSSSPLISTINGLLNLGAFAPFGLPGTQMIKGEDGVEREFIKKINLQSSLLVNGQFWDENNELRTQPKLIALGLLLTSPYVGTYKKDVARFVDTYGPIVEGGRVLYSESGEVIPTIDSKDRADLWDVTAIGLGDLKGAEGFKKPFRRYHLLGQAFLEYMDDTPGDMKTPLQKEMVSVIADYAEEMQDILDQSELYELHFTSWRRGNWPKLRNLLQKIEEIKVNKEHLGETGKTARQLGEESLRKAEGRILIATVRDYVRRLQGEDPELIKRELYETMDTLEFQQAGREEFYSAMLMEAGLDGKGDPIDDTDDDPTSELPPGGDAGTAVGGDGQTSPIDWTSALVTDLEKEIAENGLDNFEEMSRDEVLTMFPGQAYFDDISYETFPRLKVYRHKEKPEMQLVKKRSVDFDFMIGKFEDNFDKVKEFASYKRPGAVPTFFVKGEEDEDDYVYEFNLVPFGYVGLYEFLDFYDEHLIDEVRKEISEVVADTLRFREDIWFSHGHLHVGNVLVKADDSGRIEDIKLIDWKLIDSFDPRENVDLQSFISGERTNFKDADLEGLALEWFDFSGIDFSGANLKNVDFVGSNLRGANLENTDTKGTSFRVTNLVNAKYSDGFLGVFHGGVIADEEEDGYLNASVEDAVEASKALSQYKVDLGRAVNLFLSRQDFEIAKTDRHELDEDLRELKIEAAKLWDKAVVETLDFDNLESSDVDGFKALRRWKKTPFADVWADLVYDPKTDKVGMVYAPEGSTDLAVQLSKRGIHMLNDNEVPLYLIDNQLFAMGSYRERAEQDWGIGRPKIHSNEQLRPVEFLVFMDDGGLDDPDIDVEQSLLSRISEGSSFDGVPFYHRVPFDLTERYKSKLLSLPRKSFPMEEYNDSFIERAATDIDQWLSETFQNAGDARQSEIGEVSPRKKRGGRDHGDSGKAAEGAGSKDIDRRQFLNSLLKRTSAIAFGFSLTGLLKSCASGGCIMQSEMGTIEDTPQNIRQIAQDFYDTLNEIDSLAGQGKLDQKTINRLSSLLKDRMDRFWQLPGFRDRDMNKDDYLKAVKDYLKSKGYIFSVSLQTGTKGTSGISLGDIPYFTLRPIESTERKKARVGEQNIEYDEYVLGDDVISIPNFLGTQVEAAGDGYVLLFRGLAKLHDKTYKSYREAKDSGKLDGRVYISSYFDSRGYSLMALKLYEKQWGEKPLDENRTEELLRDYYRLHAQQHIADQDKEKRSELNFAYESQGAKERMAEKEKLYEARVLVRQLLERRLPYETLRMITEFFRLFIGGNRSQYSMAGRMLFDGIIKEAMEDSQIKDKMLAFYGIKKDDENLKEREYTLKVSGRVWEAIGELTEDEIYRTVLRFAYNNKNFQDMLTSRQMKEAQRLVERAEQAGDKGVAPGVLDKTGDAGVIPKSLEYTRGEILNESGELSKDGQPLPLIDRGVFNDIFDNGETVIRVWRAKHLLNKDKLIRNHKLLGGLDVSPRYVSHGFTEDNEEEGSFYIEAEKVVGDNVKTIGSKLTKENVGWILSLLETLIENQIYILDFFPNNIMVGHKAGEVDSNDRAYLIDPDKAAQEVNFTKASLAEQYLDTFNQPIWDEYDNLAPIRERLIEIRDQTAEGKQDEPKGDAGKAPGGDERLSPEERMRLGRELRELSRQYTSVFDRIAPLVEIDGKRERNLDPRHLSEENSIEDLEKASDLLYKMREIEKKFGEGDYVLIDMRGTIENELSIIWDAILIKRIGRIAMAPGGQGFIKFHAQNDEDFDFLEQHLRRMLDFIGEGGYRGSNEPKKLISFQINLFMNMYYKIMDKIAPKDAGGQRDLSDENLDRASRNELERAIYILNRIKQLTDNEFRQPFQRYYDHLQAAIARRGIDLDTREIFGPDFEDKGPDSGGDAGTAPRLRSGQAPDSIGGIDLNPNILDLHIRRDGNGVPLPLEIDPQEIQNIKIDGLKPVIINITPITNVPLILGATEEEPAEEEGDLTLSSL